VGVERGSSNDLLQTTGDRSLNSLCELGELKYEHDRGITYLEYLLVYQIGNAIGYKIYFVRP
jgi:hypothetical protein